MEDAPSAFAECNPCYNSSLGPNPHWPYKAGKTVPNNGFDGPATTNYKGPVTSDDNVPTPANTPPFPAAAAAKFAQQSAWHFEDTPYDDEQASTYAQTISDAAEESEPEVPVMYPQVDFDASTH